jgi:thermostable 8-oxoguanine DNA glycosylase
MQYLKEKNKIEYTNEDIDKLAFVCNNFEKYIKLNKLGNYTEISNDELWFKIISQLFIINNLPIIKDSSNNAVNEKFKSAISLKSILNHKNKEEYIAHVLLNYDVTQFYKDQSKKIFMLLNNKDVIFSNKVILFDGLNYEQNFNFIRDELLKRNPFSKMKSVSEIMIEFGFSNDVLAIDSRILGFLSSHLNFNVSLEKIQSNKKLYLLIEESIRDECAKLNIKLSIFDRIIFKYLNISAIDYILEKEKMN